jgi:polysaccharide pyruvyl transferase CsaB
VLCGYYGFGNLGDEALLASAIERLRKERCKNSISVVCRSPKRIRKLYGVRAVRRENIFAVKKELRHAKRLVLGGGSILQDSTSYRSLKYYAHLMLYAAKKGDSVELLSNGLGPLLRKRSRKLAAKALSVCRRASFRDSASAALAVSLGFDKRKIFIEDDLFSSVALCAPKELDRLLRRLGCADGKPYFLVGIRGDTSRELKKAIKKETEMQKRGGLFPVFVIMHPRQDKKISKRMAKRFGGVCAKNLSPSELISLASRAESVIGNRYHLLFAAKRCGVATVPFGDDPKLLSLRRLN